MSPLQKDPDAVLDFAFDWTAWLAASETISSATITTGLTKGAQSIVAGVVTVWLSGGTDGTTYTAACQITTNQGRTDERSMSISVKSR